MAELFEEPELNYHSPGFRQGLKRPSKHHAVNHSVYHRLYGLKLTRIGGWDGWPSALCPEMVDGFEAGYTAQPGSKASL